VAAHTALAAPPAGEEFIGDSPGDDLIQRFDDPQVASSLAVILEHADLLATLVAGLDGLLRRAEVISDSLAAGVSEVRGLSAASNGQRPWPSVDVAALSDTVTRLSAAAVDATPALERVLQSPLADPQTADVLAEVGAALLEGRRAAIADPRGPKGIFALMRVTKDPDVSRGLGFMIQIARAFGRRLSPPEPPPNPAGPRHAA
jgi:hypothetical protein